MMLENMVADYILNDETRKRRAFHVLCPVRMSGPYEREQPPEEQGESLRDEVETWWGFGFIASDMLALILEEADWTVIAELVWNSGKLG